MDAHVCGKAGRDGAGSVGVEFQGVFDNYPKRTNMFSSENSKYRSENVEGRGERSGGTRGTET